MKVIKVLCLPFVNWMFLASGVIHFQLFLAVEQLVLLFETANWCVLPYYFNGLWRHWHVVQTVLPFTVLCYSSWQFPTAANELEVSYIHIKLLTSTFKNMVDSICKLISLFIIVYKQTDICRHYQPLKRKPDP